MSAADPVRKRRAQWGSLALLIAVFGLLLWARLLLVTNHPRTAIAEPGPATSSAPAAPMYSPQQ